MATERALDAERMRDPGAVVSLVQSSVVAGDANEAAGDWRRSERYFREGCEVAEKLAEQHELPGVLALAKAQQRLGALYAGLHRDEEARTWYRRAVDLLRDYPEKNRHVIQQEVAAERLWERSK